jgi:hypothetical protein
MNTSDLKSKVLEEVQLVPEEQLIALYNLVHSFRLSSQSDKPTSQNVMQFAGCWSDLSTEEYTEFLDDWQDWAQE